MQPNKKTEEDHPRAQACHASLTSPVPGHATIPRNCLRTVPYSRGFKTCSKITLSSRCCGEVCAGTLRVPRASAGGVGSGREAVEIARARGQSARGKNQDDSAVGESLGHELRWSLEIIPRALPFLPHPLSARAQLRLLPDRPLDLPRTRLATLNTARKSR